MQTLRLATLTLALLLAAGTARAVWIGANSATTDNDLHEYTNTNNWENGVIDDVITNTFTSATTLYFKMNHATGPSGLDIRNKSNDLSLKTSGGTYWMTLNGDVSHTDSTKALALYVPINLGGVPRVFNEATSGFIQWYGTMTNGTVVKTGSGVIRASSGSLYFNAPVVVNQGTLYPYQTAVNYDVPTILNNAGLLFYGGALRNTPSITLNAITGGSTLTSQAYLNGENRLGDTADLILNSAASGNARVVVTHQIDATTGIDVAERIGRIVLRCGESAMVQGSRYSGSAVFFRLDASEIVRENRSTLIINNTKTTGDSASAGNAQLGMHREVEGLPKCGNQLFLDTPPTMIGGPVNRGTDGFVIPYILGVNVVSNNTGQTLNTLMTYDAVGGMRAMRTRTDLLGNPSEFVATLAAADADGKDNVRIVANESFSGEKTVNALALSAGTLTLGAGAKVTLGSGLLAFVGGTLSANDASVIDAGVREGVVMNGGGKAINASLAGSNGYTFSTFNSTLTLTGTNSYIGQTTVVSGTLHAYRASATPHNVAFPDDGLVLVHPGATLRIGDSTTADRRTREIIGSLAGSGRVQLGYISDADVEKRRSLVIGEGGSGTPGEVTLDGGTISPGMPGEVGTLSIAAEANAAAAPIPVTLKRGTLVIDITGPDVCDQLATMGGVTITAGGTLVLDVNVQGFTPSVGQEWTIISSLNGLIADGNGGKLFDTITDDSNRVNFTAAIAPDGKSVVLTAVDANTGSVLIVR